MIILASESVEILGKWGNALRANSPICVAASVNDLIDKVAGSAPSIVALDHNLQPGRVIETVKSIRNASPGVKVLLLTEPGFSYPDDDALALLKAGVRGFCVSDMASGMIQKIVQAVHQGQIWIRTELIARVVEELAKQAREPAMLMASENAPADAAMLPASPLAQLTPRQRDIAAGIGEGESNKGIARRFNITERTVKAHLTMIFRKLNVRDRVQLALLVSQR